MEYDLAQLVAWTRRNGGDVVTKENEQTVSDGTRRFRLQNDGYINVTEIDLDAEALPASEYTANGAVVTFASDMIEGTVIDTFYDHARFSDEEILACLVDAAMVVASDVKQSWRVDPVTMKIVDDAGNPSFFDDRDRPDVTLPKLIVFRAAVSVYLLKAFQAADDAIMIKDGDTTINTSLAAKSTDTATRRLTDMYVADLKRYRSEKFCGAAQGDGYSPFNILVRHRDDGTVFLFNY
jgi:hypothetical protein